jgi:hypothetical protein
MYFPEGQVSEETVEDETRRKINVTSLDQPQRISGKSAMSRQKIRDRRFGDKKVNS